MGLAKPITKWQSLFQLALL